MNSQQRKQLRYERRQQKRKLRKQNKQDYIGNMSYDDVFLFDNLIRSAKKCCNGCRWKTSTINFENFLLSDMTKIYDEIHAGIRNFKTFNSFTLTEHGKTRNIDALPIKERAIQKCLCENFLTKIYSDSFIYDNSASMKNRGMDFAFRRLKKHLCDHYRKYGLVGGILQFDFSNYFASLPHDQLKNRARKIIKDDKIYKILCSFIDDFQKLRNFNKDDPVPRGVGLGSEVSQILALDYASPIDHYIKDIRKIHGYARYMDDGYIISNSIDELKDIRKNLFIIAKKLDIKMNEKKTIITPFKNHSFHFLKMRVSFGKNGKIIMKMNKNSIKAIRRKLDIFRKWVDDGTMNPEDVFISYQSWRAHAKRCNSYDTLYDMDIRFVKKFFKELLERKDRFKCTLSYKKNFDGYVYFDRQGNIVI